MTIRKLERGDWAWYCIRASRFFIGKQADIQVASLEVGFQTEAQRLPLIGMSYDPKSDVLTLLVGDLSHMIHAPRELYVDEEPLGLTAFQIVDAEGVRQIVTLREPLMLPVPREFLA
jgi:hypothetical protein